MSQLENSLHYSITYGVPQEVQIIERSQPIIETIVQTRPLIFSEQITKIRYPEKVTEIIYPETTYINKITTKTSRTSFNQNSYLDLPTKKLNNFEDLSTLGSEKKDDSRRSEWFSINSRSSISVKKREKESQNESNVIRNKIFDLESSSNFSLDSSDDNIEKLSQKSKDRPKSILKESKF